MLHTNWTAGASGHVEEHNQIASRLLNVLDFGAVGDGSHDDTASIQAAIDAASVSGNEIYFPPKTEFYKCASGLNLSGKRNIALLGTSFYSGSIPNGAEIRYTGAGNAPFIDATGSHGIRLKRLIVTYSSPSYTGTLLDFGGNIATPNTQHVGIDECSIFGNGGRNAKALINFDQVINSRITNSYFLNADVAILGGYHWSNAILIQQNVFINLTSSDIRDTGEAWSIISNTFQSLYNNQDYGPAGAIDFTVGANPGSGVSVIGNWFGDMADPGSGSWIKYNGNSLTIQGNLCGLVAGTKFFEATVNGLSGIMLMGNRFYRAGLGNSTPVILAFGSTSGHSGIAMLCNTIDANIDLSSGSAPTIYNPMA